MTDIAKGIERIHLGRDLVAEMSREMPDISKCLWLIDKGAKLNERDEDGNTPLILAAQWAVEEIVEPLARAGARRDLRNNAGDTASDVAGKNGYQTIVAILSKYDQICPHRVSCVFELAAKDSRPKRRNPKPSRKLNF